MVLSENIIELRKQKPGLWERLKGVEDTLATSPVKLLETRSGSPTLAVEKDGVFSYLHSKYDPVKEAEGIADSIDPEEVSRHDHIFLYGVGLGYLLDVLLKRYPDVFFTLYEPNAAAFCHLLSTKLLSSWPFRRIKFLFVDVTGSEIEQNANHFFQTMYDRVMFVTLPSYERIFGEEFRIFSRHFAYSMKTELGSRGCRVRYQNLWTFNNMVNFGQNLRSDTVLSHGDRHFRGRPAILVSAGPSLTFELDNLRRIREDGSAYIFCAGSAIKSLVKHGIHPHAAVTMTAQKANVTVFQDIVDQGIDTIPLLYSTGAGHESVARYPGPKLFMLMHTDSVTPYFLRSVDSFIEGGATVAECALDLMIKLGLNPIILAGQNYAFLGDSYYADGIEYSWEENAGKYAEAHEIIEGVDGEKVCSMHGWIMSRDFMERLIANAANTTIINTTRGGAMIKGAMFRPLEQVMTERLYRRVVDELWYEDTSQSPFDPLYVKQKSERLQASLEQLGPHIAKCEMILERLRQMTRQITDQNRYDKMLFQEMHIFESSFKKIAENDFFTIFVNPMLMIENGVLQSSLVKIRAEENAAVRARYVVEEFGRFLAQAKYNMKREISPLYEDIKKNIAAFLKRHQPVKTGGI